MALSWNSCEAESGFQQGKLKREDGGSCVEGGMAVVREGGGVGCDPLQGIIANELSGAERSFQASFTPLLSVSDCAVDVENIIFFRIGAANYR